MGGPAIHVANLAAGLESRGYHTTLVAGSLARGEDSMSFLADRLVSLGIASREKFAVVRLGIPLQERVEDATTDVDYRRAYGIGRGAFVVGWVGRMTAVKDTGSVLAIVRELRELGVDAVLCMVGDGPERGRLEQLAHELGIARECFFVGYQPEIAGYYGLFDAFLLPSVNEGTPVSAIEALASETPVVANRVGGVPDVVRDGLDGYLVSAGDVDGAAAKLALLAGDRGLRKKLGRSGRARVLERYSVARLVDDVDRLYRSLLDARG